MLTTIYSWNCDYSTITENLARLFAWKARLKIYLMIRYAYYVVKKIDKRKHVMLTAMEKQILRKNLEKYEGRIEHMYKDTKGFITVGGAI